MNLTTEQVGKIREAVRRWIAVSRPKVYLGDPGENANAWEALQAALSLLDAPEAEGWRPIETAPKDGTEVWLWGYRSTEGPDPEQKPGRYIGRWHGNGWSNTRHGIHPDLWQPLPQPPHSKHDGGE